MPGTLQSSTLSAANLPQKDMHVKDMHGHMAKSVAYLSILFFKATQAALKTCSAKLSF